MEAMTSSSRSPSIGAVALLAAGLIPVAIAPTSNPNALAEVSGAVALASSAVTDGITDAAQALDTPPAAEVFDLSGLFNAEVAAAEDLFNSLISLPGTLIGDVESIISDLAAGNFGMAFSDLASIPQDIVNYVINVPLSIGNTAYDMVAVIPGEFLFNFG